MRRLLVLFALTGVAACGSGPDWRAKAVHDGEALVRQQLHDPSLQFAHVQVTGDSHSGQACGYAERPNILGGNDGIRFIFFVDGAHGRNPYIDEASAPYPNDQEDFELNWRTQCRDLGYTD